MFKPMLAAEHDPAQLRFPYRASPKIDGVRCVSIGGVATTRSLKPIPNRFVQAFFRDNPGLAGLDGELTVGPPRGDDVLRRTMSGVMTRGGEPDFGFHVFDVTGSSLVFTDRLNLVRRTVRLFDSPRVRTVVHVLLSSEDELFSFEQRCLQLGYEGVMLRDPVGAYKHGRSTVKEGGLLKVKRFVDAEGVIVGVEERMHNDNEATTNELGRTARSSHKANMVPTGMAGAFIVRVLNGPFRGATVRVPGFSAAQAVDFWTRRDEMPKRIVTFKYFLPGSKDAPRHPGFRSFRDARDMS